MRQMGRIIGSQYLTKLKTNGSFEGGSAIGDDVCVRKSGEASPLTSHLAGYIRVNADDLNHAKSMLAGNPHFEGWRNGGNPGAATDRLAISQPEVCPLLAHSGHHCMRSLLTPSCEARCLL